MSAPRRAVVAILVAVAGLATTAGPAAAHAVLAASSPAAGGRVEVGPPRVTLEFSEPVQVVNRTDVTVVDGDGVRIDVGTTHIAPGDPRQIVVPLRGPMVPDSYTVRYRVVSADSHTEFAAFVFAVGDARLGAPILAGSGGLSDESPLAVGGRVAEFAAILLLLGLLAFRALVWDPALDAAGGLAEAERERALGDGRRSFWRVFWSLAVVTGFAETIVLASKSAVVFHTGMRAALLHPGDAYRLVAATRFGDVLGWRCGTLALLVAVGFVAWTREETRARRDRQRGPLALMGVLGAAALTLLAAQGHASQAPLAPLAIAFDAAHVAAVSIWVGGLMCLAAVLLRAPRALPGGGPALAAAALARFSRVALGAVIVISLTGIARATGELSGPVQLLTTGYGRSLLLKASLLVPILTIARRNRRVVARLATGWTPPAGRLRAVARDVGTELAIAMAVIVVAAVLVAQVPGRA